MIVLLLLWTSVVLERVESLLELMSSSPAESLLPWEKKISSGTKLSMVIDTWKCLIQGLAWGGKQCMSLAHIHWFLELYSVTGTAKAHLHIKCHLSLYLHSSPGHSVGWTQHSMPAISSDLRTKKWLKEGRKKEERWSCLAIWHKGADQVVHPQSWVHISVYQW